MTTSSTLQDCCPYECYEFCRIVEGVSVEVGRSETVGERMAETATTRTTTRTIMIKKPITRTKTE